MSRIWTEATKDLLSTTTSTPDIERVTDREPPGEATDKGTLCTEIALPDWLHKSSAKQADINESVAPELNNTRARKPSIRMVPSVTSSIAWASSSVTANTRAGLLKRPAVVAAAA